MKRFEYKKYEQHGEDLTDIIKTKKQLQQLVRKIWNNIVKVWQTFIKLVTK